MTNTDRRWVPPEPRTDEPDTGAFWTATSQHRLHYSRCSRCSEVMFFPRAHCMRCGSADVETHTSAGRGTVHAHTIVRRGADRSQPVPQVIAVIDIDEGFRMVTEIVTDAPEAVAPGMRLRVKWLDQNEIALPAFEPDPG